MSRNIPRVFTEPVVAMRRYISNGLLVEHKLLEHDKRISLLGNTFDSFKEQNKY